MDPNEILQIVAVSYIMKIDLKADKFDRDKTLSL